MSWLRQCVLFVVGAICGLVATWFVEKKCSPSDERRVLGRSLAALAGVEFFLCVCHISASSSSENLSFLNVSVSVLAITISEGGALWLVGGNKITSIAVVLSALALIFVKEAMPFFEYLCVSLGLSLPLLMQACIQRSLDKSWGKVLTIKSFDWFEHLTGCDEETFRLNPSKFIVPFQSGSLPSCSSLSLSPPSLLVINCKTKEQFHAGRLNLISLGKLRSEVMAMSGEGDSLRNVPVEIVCKSPPDRKELRSESEWRRELDVANQQADPKLRDAVFQVASNFNGIEAIRESSFPEHANFARNYYSDLTQGPAASISAGAGAITRIYAPFYDAHSPAHTWGQTSTRQVNFLQNLSKFFPVQNGYVVLTKPRNTNGSEPQSRVSAPSLPTDEHELSSLLDKVMVCHHDRIQVTTGQRPRGQDYAELVLDSEQRVDQVLCAALNIGQGLEGRYNRMCSEAEPKAKFLLRAAYEGAYLSAICHQRTQLCLNLIGGGVFNNPHEWIVEAIVAAHKKWGQHAASKLQRVVLNLHTNSYLFSPVSLMFRQNLIEFSFPRAWEVQAVEKEKTERASKKNA